MATVQSSHASHPDTVLSDERLDMPGIWGIVIAVVAGVNLLTGMGIPLIPWLLSGVFAAVLLALAPFSRSPLRRPVFVMGLLCLVPPIVLGLVEVLPGLLHRSS